MRAAIDRNDPRIVDGLHVEDDIRGRLDDLIDAAVRRLESRHAERDATFAQPAVLRAVGGMQPSLFGYGGAPLLGLRRLGWNPSIRRIDDERRTPLEVARGQPEGVVVSGFSVV